MRKFAPTKIVPHTLTHVGRTMGIGAVITIPFIIVYYILKWLAQNADNLFQHPIDLLPISDSISGIGILFLLIVLYITGLIAKKSHGRKFIHFLQQLALKAPFIKSIYKPAKGFAEIFDENSLSASRVVGTYLFGEFTLGLYASKIIKDGVPCVNFYYVTSPTPNSGLVFIIPETRVYEILIQNEDSNLVSMSLGELMQHCVSCGTSSPKRIVTRPLAYNEY